MTPDPLIVSLTIDEEQQSRFDAERARLFPAGRTVIGAHVTLFHAVPGDLLHEVRADLRAVADRPAFPVDVTEVMSLGSGVAYRLRSGNLDAVHGALRKRWHGRLTAQDAQGFRPHITVQNKVSGDVARATLADLRAAFVPSAIDATGLALWRYKGGPWEAIERVPFAAG